MFIHQFSYDTFSAISIRGLNSNENRIMRGIGDFDSVPTRHRAIGVLTEARQIEEGRTSCVQIHKMHTTILNYMVAPSVSTARRYIESNLQ